jgi:hypothetical protein
LAWLLCEGSFALELSSLGLVANNISWSTAVAWLEGGSDWITVALGSVQRNAADIDIG